MGAADFPHIDQYNRPMTLVKSFGAVSKQTLVMDPYEE